ncbi:hypothetical protein DL96DRAFT_1813576 [Flagelloscypha sp. PMI_526]|nr:hypothetical protein DL96DRAFT_1813576 [Flagelloscypha sp. PMI_526]
MSDDTIDHVQDIVEPGISRDFLSLTESVNELKTLLSKQTEVLIAIGERQAAADISSREIPPVPAKSASSWNALLRSALDHIEPHVERWRGGLDTLLVFIGLFSAIVTAFFVESSKELRQSTETRTNQILTNLTEIYLAANGLRFDALNITQPQNFQPEAVDVRVNMFWCLSLIMSVSLAALAVTCRGFLASLTTSHYRNARNRLTDIFPRWERADKLLGPLVEFMPHMMLLPVFLFLAGLLDYLFSIVLNQNPQPIPLQVSVILSAVIVTLMVVNIAAFFLDGLVHPVSSPFQFLVAQIFWSWTRDGRDDTLNESEMSSLSPASNTIPQNDATQGSSSAFLARMIFPSSEKRLKIDNNGHGESLNEDQVRTYHQVVKLTHQDDLLDRAAASLQDISDATAAKILYQPISIPELSSAEVDTLVFLLSSEASFRCNLTAAKIIIRWDTRYLAWTGDSSSQALFRLVPALFQAAQRQTSRSRRRVLWDSEFIVSIARLLIRAQYPSWDWRDEWLSKLPPIFQVLFFAHNDHSQEVGLRQLLTSALEVILDAAQSRTSSVPPSIPKLSDSWWDVVLEQWLGPSLQQEASRKNLLRNMKTILMTFAFAPSNVLDQQRVLEPTEPLLRAVVRWCCSQFSSQVTVCSRDVVMHFNHQHAGTISWRMLAVSLAEVNESLVHGTNISLDSYHHVLEADILIIKLICQTPGWDNSPPHSRHPFRWETDPLIRILHLAQHCSSHGLAPIVLHRLAQTMQIYLNGVDASDEDEQWRIQFLKPVVELTKEIWPSLLVPVWGNPAEPTAETKELEDANGIVEVAR